MFLDVVAISHPQTATCLGSAHTEKAFLDGSCSHCENMIMAKLQSRLSFLVRGVTLVALCPGPSAKHKATAASAEGDIRATIPAGLPFLAMHISPGVVHG